MSQTHLQLHLSYQQIKSRRELILKFQGHHYYDLEMAWALMEYAGYDMDPWRSSYDPEVIFDVPALIALVVTCLAVLCISTLIILIRRRRKR